MILVASTQILPSSGSIARTITLSPLRGDPKMTIECHFGGPGVSSRLVPSRDSSAIDFVANRLVTSPVQSPRAGGRLRVIVVTPLTSGPQLVVENHLSACTVCEISLPWLGTVAWHGWSGRLVWVTIRFTGPGWPNSGCHSRRGRGCGRGSRRLSSGSRRKRGSGRRCSRGLRRGRRRRCGGGRKRSSRCDSRHHGGSWSYIIVAPWVDHCAGRCQSGSEDECDTDEFRVHDVI